MQENNFEKQVQQKMEELSFTPSAPVWQKVELQIRKDKDRRRLILWLLPFLLLGGGLVWYLAQPQPGHPTAQKPAPHAPEVSTPAPIENENKAVSNNKKETAVIRKTADAVPAVTAKSKTNSTNATNEKENIYNYNKSRIPERRNIKATPFASSRTQQQKPEKEASRNDAVAMQQEAENNDVTVNKNETAGKTETEKATITIKEEEVAAEEKKEASTPLDTTTTPVITPTETATEKVVTKEKKETKWQWDVRAAVGMANQVAGLFDNFGGTQADRDVFASPVNNSSGGLSTPGAAFVGPSQPERGLSYTIGAMSKYKAGKRSFITAGLQYSYYTTHLKVGRFVRDSSIAFNNSFVVESRYYLNNNRQSSFTNKYHFIELPIGFQYQLFKNIPLQLHHGISFGYLVASNAMYYDNRVNVYYNNKKMIRESSLALFSSADYRLWKGAQFSIFAGPYVQYGMRTLYKTAANNGGHLLSTGINTRISF